MASESPTRTMSTPAASAVRPWGKSYAVIITSCSPRRGAAATQGTVTLFASPAIGASFRLRGTGKRKALPHGMLGKALAGLRFHGPQGFCEVTVLLGRIRPSPPAVAP